MAHTLALTSAIALCAMTLGGCTAPAGNDPSSPVSPAQDPQTRTPAVSVVVANYPLEFLVKELLGDKAEVTNLVPPGVEPHDVDITPQGMQGIATADLVVYQAGFQAALDEAIAGIGPKQVYDATTGVKMYRGVIHANDTSADEPGDEGGELGVSELDPHIWLYPKNMVTMAQGIAASFENHPELAPILAQTLPTLVSSLNDLDKAFKDGLARWPERESSYSCERSIFVTSHAAFGYWHEPYGLNQVAVAGLDPTVEPTAERIALVQNRIKQYGVTTIFFETLTSDAVAKSIANDLHLETAVLDPIEGITGPDQDYFTLMEANLEALKLANGCK
jgi:zinc transport system substrate-binding protein